MSRTYYALTVLTAVVLIIIGLGLIADARPMEPTRNGVTYYTSTDLSWDSQLAATGIGFAAIGVQLLVRIVHDARRYRLNQNRV